LRFRLIAPGSRDHAAPVLPALSAPSRERRENNLNTAAKPPALDDIAASFLSFIVVAIDCNRSSHTVVNQRALPPVLSGVA